MTNIAAILDLWNAGFDTAEIATMLRVKECEVWNTFARLHRARLAKRRVPKHRELCAVYETGAENAD